VERGRKEWDTWARCARADREGIAAWVDPEGYRQWLIGIREKFESTVNTELGVPAPKLPGL